MNTLKTFRPQKFKCTLCPGTKYTSPGYLIKHTLECHCEMIPEGISVEQFLFDQRNPNSTHICPICKKNKVKWNQKTLRYDRFCDDVTTNCKEVAGERAKENMRKAYGQDHLLNDPEMQRKMLEGRSISGVYKFSDKKNKVKYVGTYELDFLRFYDIDMRLSGHDIDSCPFTFAYSFDKAQHFYIPDFYIASLNLIIEIKDGGDNPNMHKKILEVDKVKEKLKDEAIIKKGCYNYIKIVNKDYTQFVELINTLKNLQNKEEPYIVITQ